MRRKRYCARRPISANCRTSHRPTTRLAFEQLETRNLLDSHGLAGAHTNFDRVSPAWFAAAEVTPPPHLAATEFEGRFAQPANTVVHVGELGEWIIRLTPESIEHVQSVQQAADLLNQSELEVHAVRGLGLPGQLLIHTAADTQTTRTVLSSHPDIASVEPNSVVSAQRAPNDAFFGNLTGLHNVGQFEGVAGADINAPEAWDITVGSSKVVVGVLDSGIDLAHPDLYLNMWINQGEIRESLRRQLIHTDDDGLFTFRDLNAAANAAFVTDFNGNDYIDAHDLLDDPRWADGVDTDGNGFVDDFFGWNFRAAEADEPYAANNPTDQLGHGTHVAGTIGAVGNNGIGITGINWQSSLMALKFLDQNNQGETADAIAAINYAKMMRESFGVNVPVLNNSWGQSGGASSNLRDVIEGAGRANMLFVAAAGNGNVLGQGNNNDATPFYPASYELDNVISVAAADGEDKLAPFSNFGFQSVDIAAPGVGVLSTQPEGRFSTANGTSMAAPHVAGSAALIWSEIPDATADEVRHAILGSVDQLPSLLDQQRIVTGGRLNAAKALQADSFAPRSQLVEALDVHVAGGATHPITVEFHDRQGIDVSSISADNIAVSRPWDSSNALNVRLVRVDVSPDGTVAVATYEAVPPEGTWDILDYGPFQISLLPDQVANHGGLTARGSVLGTFRVAIIDDSVIVVDSLEDSVDIRPGDGISQDATGRSSLRSAIQEANASDTARTILLDVGTYSLSIPGRDEEGAAAGDLDIHGDVTILGADARVTTIDGARLDRVFEVHSNATLHLHGVTVTGGAASSELAGAGIRNLGTLNVRDSIIVGNMAVWGAGVASLAGSQTTIENSRIQNNIAEIGGGGVLSHEAHLHVVDTLVAENTSEGFLAGGIYVIGGAATIISSTIAENRAFARGGGLVADTGAEVEVVNSTVSGNIAASGGGLWVGDFLLADTARINVLSSTITKNASDNLGAIYAAAGTLQLKNSIVAGNVGFDGFDISGTGPKNLRSLGHNLVGQPDSLVSDVFTQVGDQISTSAARSLGPLEDNGGPTPTHALLPGSPAIDAASSEDTPPVDQRGLPRLQDGNQDGILASDIGAFERVFAEISGVLFHDLDGDRARDLNEPGLAGRTVFLDLDLDGSPDPREPQAITRADDPNTVDVVESGRYVLRGLPAGDYQLTHIAESGWRSTTLGSGQIELVSRSLAGTPLVASLLKDLSPSISATGRFVAFASPEKLLDVAANEEAIYVLDRQNQTIELLGTNTAGFRETGPTAISGDGRYVAYSSASRIVIYDRRTKTENVVKFANRVFTAPEHMFSMDARGRFLAFQNGAEVAVYDREADTSQLLGAGSDPSISANGRFVATSGISVYDRETGVAHQIAPGDFPALSEDGRFVVFSSVSDALVEDDSNVARDIFVYDREAETMERVSVSSARGQAECLTLPNVCSDRPTVSGNGRYVAFASRATNLVEADTNEGYDIFVHDRQTGSTERINVAVGGQQASPASQLAAPRISRDGRFVAFVSDATNLVDQVVTAQQVYVRSTSEAGNVPSISVDLLPGQVLPGVEIGIVPLPGVIRGQHFEDANRDGIRDPFEEGLEGWTIYIDVNSNGRLDESEPRTTTNFEGKYEFLDLASLKTYTIAMAPRDGWRQTLPLADDSGTWTVFVNAGANLNGLDFGVIPISTAGQSQESEVRGILFEDLNGNGVRDSSEPGVAGVEVFLDLSDDGARQFDEPRTLTAEDNPATAEDEAGSYAFEGLGQGAAVVRVKLDRQRQQTAPLGNDFELQPIALGGLSAPQTIAVDDIDQDGDDDIVIAGGNAVSVLLNDRGQFLPAADVEDLALPKGQDLLGQGPFMLLADDFNANGQRDIATVNYLNSTATILFDFDGQRFAGRQTLPVGPAPRSIATGDFDRDGDLDLVTANEFSGGSISIIKNVRAGGQTTFVKSTDDLRVGGRPWAVIAGQFNDDNQDERVDSQDAMDLAVANFSENNIAILLNDGNGSFDVASSKSYSVGNGPASLTAADFDEDGFIDLAVANFLSNNLRVLTGRGDGQFDLTETSLPTGAGPMSLKSADLDGDGDLDLAVASVNAQEVSIIRNTIRQREFGFEPAKNFGVANLINNQALTVDIGQLDAAGLPDLAVANKEDNAVLIMSNQRVQGANRAALDGTNSVANLDFGIRRINLPPSLNPISGPLSIVEDARPQRVRVTGLSAGESEQSFAVDAASDRPELLQVTVNHHGEAEEAELIVTPEPDQHGTATITVTVTDQQGLKATQVLVVNVLSVDDPPTVVNDSFFVAPGENRLDVLANDSTVDEGKMLALVPSSEVPPHFGTLSVAEDGSHLNYTPSPEFPGFDFFYYSVTDGILEPQFGMVTLHWRGDANLDGRVDFTDFVALADNFGGDGKTHEEGDLDGNGSVNFDDFVILAANFGRGVTRIAVAALFGSSPVEVAWRTPEDDEDVHAEEHTFDPLAGRTELAAIGHVRMHSRKH